MLRITQQVLQYKDFAGRLWFHARDLHWGSATPLANTLPISLVYARLPALSMAAPLNIKVVEVCRVSPPSGSIPTTTLPLTVFDVPWLDFCPIKSLFFYQLMQPNFTSSTIVPKLKHSLSLTLQHFFSLAGNLTYSPETGEQEIRYIDGDAVTVTFAEFDADFHRFIANYPREETEFDPLIPHLPTSDPRKRPLLSLQITIFPNSGGICIGNCMDHVVADGRSYYHFMKSWGSIYRSGDGSVIVPRPFYDRSVIAYLDGLKRLHFQQLNEALRLDSVDEASEAKVPAGFVLATFGLGREDIGNLRCYILSRHQDKSQQPFHCSSFVVTFAYVIICWVKARLDDVINKSILLYFPVDCRERLDPPIPATYFGNCVGPCQLEASARDLAMEDGLVYASKLLGRAIQGLDDGVLKGSETWIPTMFAFERQPHIAVAWSPKYRLSDIDFGWGKLKKLEVTSIVTDGEILMAESRDKEGGIEISLGLPKSEMEKFACLFEQGLKFFSGSSD